MTELMRKRIENAIFRTQIHQDERLTNGAVIEECNSHKDELDEFELRLVNIINAFRLTQQDHRMELESLHYNHQQEINRKDLLNKDLLKNIKCGKCFESNRLCGACEEERIFSAAKYIYWLAISVIGYFVLSKILYWTWWFLLLSKAGTGSTELLQLLKDYIGTL